MKLQIGQKRISFDHFFIRFNSFILFLFLTSNFPLSIECQMPAEVVSEQEKTETSSTTSYVETTTTTEHVVPISTTNTITTPTTTTTEITMEGTTTPTPTPMLNKSRDDNQLDSFMPLDIYEHPVKRKKFELPPGYNKELRPSRFGDPVIVEFDIHVQAINPIKAADMDFRMEVLFSFRWTDLRLNFTDDVFYDNDHLLLPQDHIDLIWHPDPYIVNAKQTEVGQLTGKLAKVYIYRNHTVVYSINLFVTVACAMQFQYYPFDFQLCPMLIESFSYDETKVKYEWSKSQKFTVNPRLRLLQFVVTYPLVAEECTFLRIKEDHNVSQLIAYFRFDRLLGNHLIQTFSPCSLVTALSWLSFWFELDAIPARVSLLVTSLLILVTQFSGLKLDMPPVAYIKAVDIWMAGCMLFVFFALAEFVIVKIIYSKTEDTKQHLMMYPSSNNYGNKSIISDDDEDEDESDTTSTIRTSSRSRNLVRSFGQMVTPNISPVMRSNQIQQRSTKVTNVNGGGGGRIGSSSSTIENYPTTQHQHPHYTTTNHPPHITLVKSFAYPKPKLGSDMNYKTHQNYNNNNSKKIHSVLNVKLPFCCSCITLPLIWTNHKTKKTHVLWKEIDSISRWIFPFTFGLFLTVYWLVLYVHSRIHAPPSYYGTC